MIENDNYRICTTQYRLGGFYKRPLMIVVYILLIIGALAGYIMNGVRGISFTLIFYLCILVPLFILFYIFSETLAKMLEFRKDGIAIYNYNMKYEKLILWSEVVSAKHVRSRGQNYISIKCINGKRYTLYTDKTVVEILAAKGKIDSMEDFLSGKNNNYERNLIIYLIVFLIVMAIIMVVKKMYFVDFR